MMGVLNSLAFSLGVDGVTCSSRGWRGLRSVGVEGADRHVVALTL